MRWNHRVFKDKEGNLTIRETYYDGEGNIQGWTGPVEPHGIDLAELRQDLEWMLGALDKPVLEDET